MPTLAPEASHMATVSIADIHGADYQFFKDNGGYAPTPLVVVANLCKLERPVAARIITGRDGKPKTLAALNARLISQEINLLTQMVIYRYAFAEPLTGKETIHAVPGLKFLAEKINRSERQVQRLIERLKLRDLIDVRERPGRPSVIDISKTIAAVKALPGLKPEKEQPPLDLPDAPAEATEVIQPEEDALFWQQAAESEPEDAMAETTSDDGDIGARMDWQRLMEHIDARGYLTRGQRRWLDETRGLRWQGQTLVVRVRDRAQANGLKMLEATISLSVLDVFDTDCDVRFEPARRVKAREPALTR